MGNVVFKNRVLLKTVHLLFEGLTRRLSSFELLKYLYQGAFKEINVHQIYKDLE